MKRLIFLVWFTALCLAGVTAQAAGLIVITDPAVVEIFPPRPPHPPIPHPPVPMPPPRVYPFAPLELTQHKVHTRITDQIATTSIEEEFYNPNPRNLEGTFLFPVPKGAHVDKFTMEIDGKTVQAELLAADKARGIYEDIVRRMKDPALLEYAGRDLFKVRIFPIESHSRKHITLAYSELLKSDAGLVGYTLPLNTAKYSAQPIKNVSLKIDIDTKRPLKSVYSPSHNVEIKRESNHATIGFEARDVKPDTDFQLYFSQEKDQVGLSLIAHKNAGEDGYFLLLASPGVEVKEKKTVPKDVVFVLDTSGSMAGKKLTQAKKALLFCVENLNSNDRFEVVRFSTETEPVFNRLVEANADNRQRATDFIKDLKPIGSTAIDDALRKAMSFRPEDSKRQFIVIFLTDGLPTIGVTNEDDIVAGVRRNSGGNTRVFCFGIGSDVNTHLLDKITEETKAYSQYVLPDEDLEVKLSSFYTRIKEPVLANLKIVVPDGMRFTKMYPSALPDLFKGDQLALVGRYSGKGEGRITLEGTVNGEVHRFTLDVNLPEHGSDHEFIPRLWATRRVGYLLDEIRLHGENQEAKEEVTDLARRYSIVTPYTAYLIVEDETRRGVALNQQVLPGVAGDRDAFSQSREFYRSFQTEKSGDNAVANAQSSYALKEAGAVDALRKSSDLALRGQLAPAAPPVAATPAPTTTASNAGRSRQQAVARMQPTATQAANERLSQYSQQNQFVAGKSFYQNSTQWVDAEAQKLGNTKPIRVQFNSREYFDLVAKNPESTPWLALGTNLQLVIKGTLYEIYD